MPTRPEILYPLFGQLTQFSGIGPKIALNLAKLNIDSPRDLIFTLPHSLLIRKKIKTMLSTWEKDSPGRVNNIFGAISNIELSHLADKSLFDFESLKLSDISKENLDSFSIINFINQSQKV